MTESLAHCCLRHRRFPHRSVGPAKSRTMHDTRGLLERVCSNCASTLTGLLSASPTSSSGEGRIVLLTEFLKQRMSERGEIARARAAMARCIREGHTAEEDDR
jgi:hypothetical protein